MLCSSSSITPASTLSATSRRISSSVTTPRPCVSMRSRRSSRPLEALSNHTNGEVIRASTSIGMAAYDATFSGAASASRLGTSSPITIWMYEISAKPSTMPAPRAYGSSQAMCSPVSTAAMWAPSASPATAPVTSITRVMPTCTVERKRSGASAWRSAAAALRLVRAICLRRLGRDATKAISDSAKKPLHSASTKTSAISVSIAAKVSEGAWAQCKGRAAPLHADIDARQHGHPVTFPSFRSFRHDQHVFVADDFRQRRQVLRLA